MSGMIWNWGDIERHTRRKENTPGGEGIGRYLNAYLGTSPTEFDENGKEIHRGAYNLFPPCLLRYSTSPVSSFGKKKIKIKKNVNNYEKATTVVTMVQRIIVVKKRTPISRMHQ